jgi:membrane fusion protein, peptide pheromone/bacteriocin exporter
MFANVKLYAFFYFFIVNTNFFSPMMEITPLNTDFCIENQLFRHSRKSRRIYLAVVLSLFLALLSLPFILVDVTVQSSGTIRPVTEKVEIKSSLSETIQQVMVQEGDQVKTGDIILTLNTTSIDAKIEHQQAIEQDYERQIADLKQLSSRSGYIGKIRSPSRFQESLLFQRQKDEIRLRLENAEKKLSRNARLYESGVISIDDYENFLLEKDKCAKEFKTLVENRLCLWKSDLNELQRKQGEVRSTLQQLEQERTWYTIHSPTNGTLDEFSGIYAGAVLLSGQSIAVISPDSTLLVESYVSPKDIGYLHAGMPVNIQVESFNYNQWGLLKGKITDISSDFILSDQNAYYKVKCRVNQSYLTRKTGQKGHLKKGMSVQTRFIITKRSLLELIYQKFDDWANPAVSDNQNTAA